MRLYTAPPLGPDHSTLARRQALLWADAKKRVGVARRMYAWRLGEVLPHRDIAVLRGIEGARMKETYRLAAARAGIRWDGRRYDRANPNAADLPNQALNHAASAVEAAAAVACAAVGAIPQLGFIHEDPGQSLVLDIADLFRDSVTIPVAFAAAREAAQGREGIERLTRRQTGRALGERGVIPQMIDRLKALFEAEASDAAEGPAPTRRPRAGRRPRGDGQGAGEESTVAPYAPSPPAGDRND